MMAIPRQPVDPSSGGAKRRARRLAISPQNQPVIGAEGRSHPGVRPVSSGAMAALGVWGDVWLGRLKGV